MGQEPRVGLQEREVSCVHVNGTIVPLRWCVVGRGRVAGRRRTCVLPRDCVVGDWSSWSTVVPGCVAPSGLVVREVRERRRRAMRLQQGLGVPCPHLLERHTLPDPSLQPCDTRYQWVSSAWRACVGRVGGVEVPVACGGGVQTRQLTCVRAADHVPVPDDMCEHVEPPPRVQRCEVGCERDCVVGPWSAWGVCTPTDCTAAPPPATPGYRRRRREVVVSPSNGGGECAPLEEQSECVGAVCHSWVLGAWSECQLHDHAHTCGPGSTTRTATCIDSADVPAPAEECRSELGDAVVSGSCHVPCPYDCVVGVWSSWSPCSRPCASPTTVGFTTRNASIVAHPGPGGGSCPAPDELTEVETCRVEPCGGASWVAGPWGACQLPARATCGPGRQGRELSCHLYNGTTTAQARCAGLTRPELERTCEVPCATPCTVTPWSRWSPCLTPSPCPIDGVGVASVQRRWRRVLVPGSAGAAPCPALEEQRGCAQNPATCARPQWRLGHWSKCLLADGVECGVGYRTRRVECRDAMGRPLEPTKCLLGSAMVPEESQECHVSCVKACVTSTWSPWTPCPATPPCATPSTRTRHLLDGTERNPECSSIALQQSTPCHCHSFYSRPSGPWSTCILHGDASSTPAAPGTPPASPSTPLAAPGFPDDTGVECGVGTRYRSLLCYRNDGVLAHPRSCGHGGVASEPCMEPCWNDCQVATWQGWTPCNATCGAGVQTRRRQVTSPRLWGGRACPETLQTRACWGLCLASWVPGGWSECVLGATQDCGQGNQTRSVRCMVADGRGVAVGVAEEECRGMDQPGHSQTCTVACPGQCVVSPWAPWSTCPRDCRPSATRRRERTILRAGSGVGSCPPLAQEESCVVGVSCWSYAWRVHGNWTSCVPLGESVCGEGVRNRPVSCTRSDGVPVPERYCRRDTKPTPVETWCYVDCPIDCAVSPWTDWDTSKCSCGENAGQMERRRYLAVSPSALGRPCPDSLHESRPCPAMPCYTWERGPWSPCVLEGGECGHGWLERNVSCVGPGGQAVDHHLCLALVHVGGHTWPYLARALDLNTKDGCYVPCKGDCELTEWAPWSHCHRDCSKGHQGGTQTRSRAVLTEGGVGGGGRAPCPGPLWESRPCLAGPCLNYTWQARNGSVRCVRSDGLVVQGGCEGQPRPCVGVCVVRGSVCARGGGCVCRAGLKPSYARFRLHACVPSLNLTFGRPLALAQPKYLPEDINVWMFAMVSVGTAFVVFVAISMYLLCQSPRDQASITVTLSRQKSLRLKPV